MSKYSANLKYTFNPSASTISFSSQPGFNIQWLLAIVDVTTNNYIYLPGVAGFGLTALSASGSVLTLANPLSGCASTDILQFHYDDQQNALAGMLSLFNGSVTNPSSTTPNSTIGAYVQSVTIQEILERIRTEIRITNYLLAKSSAITTDTVDLDSLFQSFYNDFDAGP